MCFEWTALHVNSAQGVPNAAWSDMDGFMETTAMAPLAPSDVLFNGSAWSSMRPLPYTLLRMEEDIPR